VKRDSQEKSIKIYLKNPRPEIKIALLTLPPKMYETKTNITSLCKWTTTISY